MYTKVIAKIKNIAVVMIQMIRRVCYYLPLTVEIQVPEMDYFGLPSSPPA